MARIRKEPLQPRHAIKVRLAFATKCGALSTYMRWSPSAEERVHHFRHAGVERKVMIQFHR